MTIRIKQILTIIFCLGVNLCLAQSEWRHLYNSPTTAMIYAIDCPNDSTCYFGSANGMVFKTVDGGKTFITLNVGAVGKIHAVSFQTALKGYLLAPNGIFKTLDGGINWYTLYATNFNNYYGDMKFYNDSIGVAACNGHNNYFTGSVSTVDAGQIWGFSIGGFQLFSDVEFLSPDIIFVAGNAGIRRTLTGPVSNAWSTLSVGSQAIYDISVVDSSHIYAVAPVGRRTFKSSDLGNTWTVIDSTNTRTCVGCHFHDTLSGYVSGSSGSNCLISNTIDGGNTWTDTIFSTVNGFIYRFSFPSVNVGFAVGSGGHIFKYGTSCSTSSTINPVTCSRYTSPSGRYTWNTSGTYYDYLPNSTGCDSIITVNLTINYLTSSQTITSCNPYISPSGNYTWDTTGTYTDTLTNVIGCDSIITINLTSKSISTQTITSCGYYTSPSGNYVYSTSGTYVDTIPNSAACDSIITINLTLNNTDSTITVLIPTCSYISPSGNYTWIASGTYVDTIPNSIGCDSIITINLSINNTTAFQLVTVCNQFISPSGNYVWTISGTYKDTIANSIGCDSVITVLLTIPVVITSVTNNGPTLTANAINASYQWIDCSFMVPINGETNKSFTPASNGSYAVIIGQNGCTDTSVCFTISNVSIDENNFDNSLAIFPNPVKNSFTITAPNFIFSTLLFYDITGRTILKQPFNTKAEINISALTSGVYIVELKNKKGNSVKGKVVKE